MFCSRICNDLCKWLKNSVEIEKFSCNRKGMPSIIRYINILTETNRYFRIWIMWHFSLCMWIFNKCHNIIAFVKWIVTTFIRKIVFFTTKFKQISRNVTKHKISCFFAWIRKFTFEYWRFLYAHQFTTEFSCDWFVFVCVCFLVCCFYNNKYLFSECLK